MYRTKNLSRFASGTIKSLDCHYSFGLLFRRHGDTLTPIDVCEPFVESEDGQPFRVKIRPKSVAHDSLVRATSSAEVAQFVTFRTYGALQNYSVTRD